MSKPIGIVLVVVLFVWGGAAKTDAGQPEFNATEKANPPDEVAGQDELAAYPTAILPFNERGTGTQGYGGTVTDLLFASLVVHPHLFLVDREDMAKTLSEQELSLSGIVSSNDAVQVGNLIGAKVLITGSVFDADGSLYVVARIIGTETSRVFGQSVQGSARDALGPLVEELSGKVANTILERAEHLVAPRIGTENRIATLNEKLGDADRPTLMVRIEERHVGRMVIDPAAETEVTLFAEQSGFPVVAPQTEREHLADILITGEGFSEFAMRRGNLVSVQARLEVNAVDRRTGEILAIDRQTVVEVDLSEQVAGKTALQNAAAQIAERMLPKLVAQ